MAYGAAEGWSGWCGMHGPEYVARLGEQLEYVPPSTE